MILEGPGSDLIEAGEHRWADHRQVVQEGRGVVQLIRDADQQGAGGLGAEFGWTLQLVLVPVSLLG